MRGIHGIVCEANGNPAADRFFIVQDPIVDHSGAAVCDFVPAAYAATSKTSDNNFFASLGTVAPGPDNQQESRDRASHFLGG